MLPSGGSLIVIDGLEMFGDLGRQRTVNELLREAATVPGFTVVAAARSNDDVSTNRWIADDVIDAFGGIQCVSVGELTDEEVETLSDKTPELRAILAPGHPGCQYFPEPLPAVAAPQGPSVCGDQNGGGTRKPMVGQRGQLGQRVGEGWAAHHR